MNRTPQFFSHSGGDRPRTTRLLQQKLDFFGTLGLLGPIAPYEHVDQVIENAIKTGRMSRCGIVLLFISQDQETSFLY